MGSSCNFRRQERDSARVVSERRGRGGEESDRGRGRPPRCRYLRQHRRLTANDRILERVVGRDFEERPRRLGLGDVRQAIGILAAARVAVLRHDEHLEIRREPLFRHDQNRLLVADRACGDRRRHPRPGRQNALDHLLPEIFLVHRAAGVAGRHHPRHCHGLWRIGDSPSNGNRASAPSRLRSRSRSRRPHPRCLRLLPGLQSRADVQLRWTRTPRLARPRRRFAQR